jgi:Putative adhesin
MMNQYRSNKKLLAVGSVIAALSLGYGVLFAVSAMAHSKTRSDISMPGDITAIEIDLSAGDVVLIGDGGDKITGTRTVERSLTGPSYSEKRNGGTLKLSASCNGFLSVNCNVRYELHVPPNVTVRGSSSGGSIRTDRVTGAVNVSSSGGDVTVIGTRGAVDVSSSGGDVKVLESRSDSVKADSSGGDVRVEFASPPANVDVSSSGGDVTVVVPDVEGAYQVDASSSGGGTSVDVRTDKSSPKHIKADSSGGDVTVTYPVPV